MMSCANGRLKAFVDGLTERVNESGDDEPRLLAEVGKLLRVLVSVDDWLDPTFARADPSRYRQYLLHADPAARFSVVSFVWGPGQETPIHNHTVWGAIGMLRGAEISQHYVIDAYNRPLAPGPACLLKPGDVAFVSPAMGDIHSVRNAFHGRTSISIHVYGGDIGRIARSVYSADGGAKPFVSGYS